MSPAPRTRATRRPRATIGRPRQPRGTNVLPALARDEIAIIGAKSVVVLRLDDGAPLPSTPGGWVNVARPQRTSITDWQGSDEDELPVACLLDGMPDRSVEPILDGLMALYRPRDENGQLVRPGPVTIRGGVPHGGHRWVIADVAESDAITAHGRRVQWHGAVTFRRYTPADLVAAPAKSRTTKANKRYRVRAGDTLNSIAIKQCDAKTHREVAAAVTALRKLNGIRDPRRIKVGQIVRLP